MILEGPLSIRIANHGIRPVISFLYYHDTPYPLVRGKGFVAPFPAFSHLSAQRVINKTPGFFRHEKGGDQAPFLYPLLGYIQLMLLRPLKSHP